MSHDHRHARAGTTLVLATLFTLGFAAVEAGVGLWAGSLALVADAGHMVNDAAALALAAGAAWLARRPPRVTAEAGWPGYFIVLHEIRRKALSILRCLPMVRNPIRIADKMNAG